MKKNTNKVDGNTSDGYHTFNELYYHRTVLFAVICNLNKDISWKSKKHKDGTMYDVIFCSDERYYNEYKTPAEGTETPEEEVPANEEGNEASEEEVKPEEESEEEDNEEGAEEEPETEEPETEEEESSEEEESDEEPTNDGEEEPDLNSQLAAKDAEIADLKAQLEELNSYKAQKVHEEKEQVIETYSKKLSEEEVENFKNKIDEFESAIELKKEIALCILDKEVSEEAEEPSNFSFVKNHKEELKGAEAIVARYAKNK